MMVILVFISLVVYIALSFIRKESLPERVEKEKEILKAQTMNEGKPEAIAEKIVMGRINKFYEEICLVDQVYVRAEDGKQSVGQYIAEVAKANGANLSIKKFVRFETGEGIEKKQEDFAAEVAKQMG